VRQTESTMDLPITVAILYEQSTKEFQFSWETFLVIDVSSLVYQDGEHRMLTGQVMV